MICVSLMADTTDEMLRLMKRSFAGADMVELRVDACRDYDPDRLLPEAGGPLLVTNRCRREGGRFSGTEDERCAPLIDAIGRGVAYVDLELAADRSTRETLVAEAARRGRRTKVILSFHDFVKTPSEDHLMRLIDEGYDRGADLVKLAVTAVSLEDNLTILRVLCRARDVDRPVTAFCMGEAGRLSRLAAPLFGSVITYAALEKGRESASGQFTVEELRMLERLLL